MFSARPYSAGMALSTMLVPATLLFLLRLNPGTVPKELGNLRKMEHLDLGGNPIEGECAVLERPTNLLCYLAGRRHVVQQRAHDYTLLSFVNLELSEGGLHFTLFSPQRLCTRTARCPQESISPDRRNLFRSHASSRTLDVCGLHLFDTAYTVD